MQTLKLTILDTEGELKSYDFNGAIFKLDLINNETTYTKGYFIYNKHSRSDGSVSFELYDYMYRLEKEITNLNVFNGLTYLEIVEKIGTDCGFTFDLNSFSNSDLTFSGSVADKTTYRNMLNYVAQCACMFAIFKPNGNLTFKEYPKTNDATTSVVSLNNNSTCIVSENDTTITGIAVIMVNDNDEEERFLSGSEGYVLEISDNPLINSANISRVMATLNNAFVGMNYRAFNVNAHSDLRVELGDSCSVTDYKSNVYYSFVMTLSYKINSNESITAVARSSEENSKTSSDLITRIIKKTNQEAERLLNVYDSVASNMTELISQGFGMYSTKELQSDGSYINYLHDKETVEASSVVWKLTSNGLLVSNNGGTTWAVDSNGNALFNVLTARKINAEQLNINSVFKNQEAINTLVRTNDFTNGLISNPYLMSESARIEALENQVDGTVQIYTATEIPTMDNYPANTWFEPIYPPFSDADAEDYQFPSFDKEYKNLLTYPYFGGSSKTVSGITFTVNDDGTITANGTATSNAVFILNDETEATFPLEDGKTYTFGANCSTTNVLIEGYRCNNGVTVYTSGSSSKTFTYSATSDNARIYVYVKKGATVNNVVIKPVLVEGSSFPNGYIKPQDEVKSYAWTFTKEEYRKHLGSIVYVDGSAYTYKFILNENEEFEFIMLSDTETAYILSKLSEIEANVDGLTSTVSNISGKVTSQGLAISQNASQIQQNATAITTKVSSADYNGSNIVSKINQTASTVQIDAKNINLNGVVTANSNFKIKSDGSMEAKNGSFTGTVNATGGTFDGTVKARGDLQLYSTASGAEPGFYSVMRMGVRSDAPSAIIPISLEVNWDLGVGNSIDAKYLYALNGSFTNEIRIGNTTLTEAQLKKLLALIK